MPRVPCRDEESYGDGLAASLGAGARKPPRNKHTRSATKKKIEQALAEHADAVIKGKRPGEPRHLVANYLKCHFEVYGVRAEELYDPREWLGACSAAKRMIAEDFGGSFDAAVDYAKWLWSNEARRVASARDAGAEIKRVLWRAQFMWKEKLTNYRFATKKRAP